MKHGVCVTEAFVCHAGALQLALVLSPPPAQILKLLLCGNPVAPALVEAFQGTVQRYARVQGGEPQ